jgi:hypothetical protein
MRMKIVRVGLLPALREVAVVRILELRLPVRMLGLELLRRHLLVLNRLWLWLRTMRGVVVRRCRLLCTRRCRRRRGIGGVENPAQLSAVTSEEGGEVEVFWVVGIRNRYQDGNLFSPRFKRVFSARRLELRDTFFSPVLLVFIVDLTRHHSFHVRSQFRTASRMAGIEGFGQRRSQVVLLLLLLVLDVL